MFQGLKRRKIKAIARNKGKGSKGDWGCSEKSCYEGMREAHEAENYLETVLFWGFKLILFLVSLFSYSRGISKKSRSWSKVLTGGVVRFRDSIVIKKKDTGTKRNV